VSVADAVRQVTGPVAERTPPGQDIMCAQLDEHGLKRDVSIRCSFWIDI
jgi:hypothetical protein